MKTKYLIIGNSIAALSGAPAIRSIDKQGVLTVISEQTLSYSRPLISYYLGNKVSKSNICFGDKRFYEENKIEFFADTRAQKISTQESTVYCDDGTTIKFEKLLIAVGGKPIVPDIQSLDLVNEGVFTFTKLADAEKLISFIEKSKVRQAVVLGAGLIGLKCAEGLMQRGVTVTLLELADRILANTFDPGASRILEQALQEQGCRVIKEDTVVGITAAKDGSIHDLVFKSGQGLATKLLVLAIGVRPNLDLVKDTSIACGRGIITDEFMQTSVKNIYAAGDVAQGKNSLSGEKDVIAIWPVAARQGRIAGFNMAGNPVVYEGLFGMNSVEIAGVPTVSFGITNPPAEGEYEILCRKGHNKSYRKIVLRDNRIVGAIFLGKIERAGIFFGLIKDGIDVSSFKQELLNDDFGLLVLPAEYRKHLVVGDRFAV